LEATKRLYEAMFLVDSAEAGSNWDGILAAINKVLERADAEVVSLRKWADRKLAYEIAHKNRGTYILSYFKALPEKISPMEKDVNLSEQITRVLVLTTEDRPAVCIERDVSGESKAPAEYEGPSDRGPRDRRERRSEDVKRTPERGEKADAPAPTGDVKEEPKEEMKETAASDVPAPKADEETKPQEQ
jgi:small subunit ribosomal protein S6